MEGLTKELRQNYNFSMDMLPYDTIRLGYIFFYNKNDQKLKDEKDYSMNHGLKIGFLPYDYFDTSLDLYQIRSNQCF